MKTFEHSLKFDDCSIYAAVCDSTVLSLSAYKKFFKVITVKGEDCNISVFGKDYGIKDGQSMLVFPYEKGEVWGSDNGRARYNCVVFSVNSAKYGDALVDARREAEDASVKVIDDENVNSVVEKICKEIESDDAAFSSELVSLLCSQMLIYLLRHFGESLSVKNRADDANFRVCSQVMSYIDGNIYSMKSLSEIASEMGYNYSYISTLFRKTCGITLNSYFKAKRMNESKKLLNDKKMSVSEIARVMNYSSVYAFSKAFKEYFGASPGHYTGRFSTKK